MISIVNDVRPKIPLDGQLVGDGNLLFVTETKLIQEEDFDNVGLVLLEGKVFFIESNMVGVGEMTVVKPFVVTSPKGMLEGDGIVVEYTNGDEPNGDFDYGILTRIWDVEDGPYCSIDNKPIDLAGEGHSSNLYKILAEPSDFPPNYIQMIVDGILRDGDSVSIQCRSITRDELKEVTFNRLDIKDNYTTDEEGKIKIEKTKQLFLTLPITQETLDDMKVVDKPIIIQEFESKIEVFKMSNEQKTAIENWDGGRGLILNPDGSVEFK